jgi:lipoate-protein ligase B
MHKHYRMNAMSIESPSLFQVQDFKLAEYSEVWRYQKELVQRRLAGEIEDTLLLGEHPPVITLGRGSHAENLLNPAIPVVEIERGGDVTYHGPGQLVAYPIFLLLQGRRDLHRYLRDLEEVIILTLKTFEIQGERNPGWTGVWVQNHGDLFKIASIGVAVKQWVTYHGLALNINTDLAHFRQINPCGLQSQVMTSMAESLQQEISMPEVKRALTEQFQAVFMLESVPVQPTF